MTIPSSDSFRRVSNVFWSEVTLDGMKRIIQARSSDLQEGHAVFFVIDVLFDEAFGHWHAESAIFLRYWSKLFSEYPNLQIVLKADRIYKRLALKAYNIPFERIIFGGSDSLPCNNLCIFPPLFLLNDMNLDVGTFSELWKLHILYLQEAAGVSVLVPKTITTLALPRQTRENYKPNDRIIPGTRELCEKVSRMEGGYVLHTDDVTDLLEQVRIVASSQNIIVVYGSAFLVNGSLAVNSHINVIEKSHQPYPGIQSIISWINSRGNTVVYE